MKYQETIQVVLHPVLRQEFEHWLALRNATLSRIPSDPDDLPTYVVSPNIT